MKKFRFLLFSVLLLIPTLIFAQQTITGTVKDSNGEPLPGVSVVIKGTTQGTSTDFDGNYELANVNKNSILVFSYMGFSTREITVSNTTIINVSLEEDTQSLEEVVVVGYGTAVKKDLTGSVNLIKSDDFKTAGSVSAQQLIQGKVAGVQIASGGGAPGEGQAIRIRGTGSLTLTSNPLIVVDGIPMNDGAIGGARNILNSINPDDIENMTVLKDASSTAIFGSRAANGVIMITTKKGRLHQETKVSFKTSLSLSKVTDYVNVLSANQFRNLVTKLGSAEQVAKLGKANTHWQKEIYKTAPSNDNALSISGSIKEVPYRLSFGYTLTDGVLKTDEFKRTTGKLTLTPKFLDNSLKVDFNLSGSYIENKFADRGAIGSAVGYDPTQPIYDPNSIYAGYTTWLNAGGTKNNLAPINPIALLKLKNNTSEVRRLISNIKLDYELPFFKDVNVVLNAGIDKSDANGRVLESSKMPNPNADYKGFKNEYSNEATNKLLDFYANYNKDFNENNNFKLMLGYSYQAFEFSNSSFETDFINPSKNPIDKSRNTLISFFGRANYSYKDKYLLTATLRADASSKLNPNDRWGYFPSVALAWNVINEDFMQNSKTFNNLKLRLGYGEVGNVNGLGDYLFLTRYSRSVNGASYQIGDGFYQTFRPEPLNRNLKWEIGNTINAGIDYGLFDGRINGSLDFYIKKTKDLIASSTVDPFTNFGNRIDSNIGDMINKGVEFSLNATPVKTDNVKWQINYNISYNDNEVTKMPDVQSVGGITGGTGNHIQRHQEGYAPYSFYVYQQVYDKNNKPIEGVYVDRNGDNKITEDDMYLYKNPFAEIAMGLGTTVNYKNWDLNISTRANIGNYVYDNVASAITYEGRATENNILSNLSSDYLHTGFQFLTVPNLKSDYYVKNASFFKIDNITLGYNFTKEMLKNLNIRIYAAANNVLTITGYKGLDPEIPGGIDNNFYPRPKTYLVGINVDF